MSDKDDEVKDEVIDVPEDVDDEDAVKTVDFASLIDEDEVAEPVDGANPDEVAAPVTNRRVDLDGDNDGWDYKDEEEEEEESYDPSDDA